MTGYRRLVIEVKAVEELILALPEVEETTTFGNRAWQVRGKKFCWLRPFTKADLRRLDGARIPEDPILAVVVDDLAERDAVIAEAAPGIFTIEHLANFAAVLIELGVVDHDRLRLAIEDAWLAKAPARLADAWVHRGDAGPP